MYYYRETRCTGKTALPSSNREGIFWNTCCEAEKIYSMCFRASREEAANAPPLRPGAEVFCSGREKYLPVCDSVGLQSLTMLCGSPQSCCVPLSWCLPGPAFPQRSIPSEALSLHIKSAPLTLFFMFILSSKWVPHKVLRPRSLSNCGQWVWWQELSFWPPTSKDKCKVWLAFSQPNIILPLPVEFLVLPKHGT